MRFDPWLRGTARPARRPVRAAERLLPVEHAYPRLRRVPAGDALVRPRPAPLPEAGPPPAAGPPPEPAPPPEPVLLPERAPPAGQLAETIQRITAHHEDELEKAKARIEREAQQLIATERKALIRDMLEVVDDLDRALDAGRGDGDGLGEGVMMVRERFLAKLRSHGVEPTEDTGALFDPEHHEAVTIAEADSEERDGMVVDVLRRGYRIDGEVLRPARVIVGRWHG